MIEDKLCKMCYFVFRIQYGSIKHDIVCCPACGQKELMEWSLGND